MDEKATLSKGSKHNLKTPSMLASLKTSAKFKATSKVQTDCIIASRNKVEETSYTCFQIEQIRAHGTTFIVAWVPNVCKIWLQNRADSF